MSRQVYETIRNTIGALPAESGGLFGADDDQVIRHYAFDATGRKSAVTYSPDVGRVNALLRERWNPAGIAFAGFVHSHPPGCRRPSEGDRIYAERILNALPHLNVLQLPIAMSAYGGRAFELLPFVAIRDGAGCARIEEARLEMAEPERAVGMAQPLKKLGLRRSFAGMRAFARVREAYDLDRLANSRVICVGCGGAAGFIEDLARAGVGEFVLIDPDRIAAENLGTQTVRCADLGRAKAVAIRDHILDINPRARVKAVRRRAEQITSGLWERWAREPFLFGPTPERVLLLGMTDSFPAQAHVNRLALRFNLPSLCAQLYEQGRGAEVTFTVPGITRACHRCMLAPRYRAYDQGYVNKVGTAGAPIFATARVNALKGFIALAILHEGTPHPHWGPLLARIGQRNLVQIRMDPDLGKRLGVRAFDRAFAQADHSRILFDESVWLPQLPEPFCPDCGGVSLIAPAAQLCALGNQGSMASTGEHS